MRSKQDWRRILRPTPLTSRWGRVQRADSQPATPYDAAQEANTMGTGYVCEGDMDTAHVKEAALAALLTSH
jgi:hypothetical protein